MMDLPRELKEFVRLSFFLALPGVIVAVVVAANVLSGQSTEWVKREALAFILIGFAQVLFTIQLNRLSKKARDGVLA